MCRFRLIRKDGKFLTKQCGMDVNLNLPGTPMVGCKYCRQQCPHHKGVIRFLFWEFVKCKNWEA
jgi:hypothetical protein